MTKTHVELRLLRDREKKREKLQRIVLSPKPFEIARVFVKLINVISLIYTGAENGDIKICKTNDLLNKLKG